MEKNFLHARFTLNSMPRRGGIYYFILNHYWSRDTPAAHWHGCMPYHGEILQRLAALLVECEILSVSETSIGDQSRHVAIVMAGGVVFTFLRCPSAPESSDRENSHRGPVQPQACGSQYTS